MFICKNTGQIRVTNENVQDLLIAGDMIELQEVVKICTDHLVRQLEPSNALGIFRFAADHNCLLLKEAALRYVKAVPDEDMMIFLVSTVFFWRLSYNRLKRIAETLLLLL